MTPESGDRTAAVEDGSAGQIAARVVLGAAIVGSLGAIFLILDALENESKAAQLAATTPASIVFGWSIWRMPRRSRSRDSVERALNRRRSGNTLPLAYPDRAWRQFEAEAHAPSFVPSTHGAAPGMPAAMGLGYGVMALFAGLAAGQVDRFGDMTELGMFGFSIFGLLAAAGARSLVRLAARRTALRVEREAVVLGVALGYVPPVRIARKNVVAVTGWGDEIDLLSAGRRVDRLPLRAFQDPAAVARSLGLRHRVGEAIEPPERADVQTVGGNGQLSLLDLPAEVPGLGPDADDLAGARFQWRSRLALTVVFAMALIVGFVISVMWWADQREANARLLVDGQRVDAEVVDVDPGRNSSIVVRFEVDGTPLERTIHAGLFRGYPRGLLGEQVTILVDPNALDLVRSPEGRNMHPLTWVSAMVTLIFGGIALGGVRSSRLGLRMLEAASWQRARFSADRRALRQRSRNAALESPAGVTIATAARVIGLDDETWFKHAGFVTFHRTCALIVLDGRRRAAMLPTARQLSRRTPQLR